MSRCRQASRSSRAICLLVAILLTPLAADAGRDRGLRIDGLELKERTTRATERAILSTSPAEARTFLSRTAAWLIVADSRQDWDRHVAPALQDGLGKGGSPEAVASALGALPSTVRVSGPELEGGLVRLDLPAERGRVYAAWYLPQLLKSGRDTAALLNSRRPNVGLFLAGADVRRESKDAAGERLTGLYVPSTPKGLTRGVPPAMEVRELPRGGRGSLAIFGGRGGSGDEGELILEELKRFVGRDELDAGRMRAWPENGVLQQALRTIRVPSDRLVRGADWYEALALDPTGWQFEPAQVRHPSRYLAVSSPIVTTTETGGGQRRKEAIIGLVAFYAPLLMAPDEAAVYAGRGSREFFASVQNGEVPFLRHGENLWFYRGHLDRWRNGAARRPGGKARSYKEAKKQAFAWADRERSRALDLAARGPLPFRYQPIPTDELDQMVDRRRRVRGRIYRDDLAEWLRHFDRELDAGELDPVFALAGPGRFASLRGSWAEPTPAPTAVASAKRPERGEDGLARAPLPSWMEAETGGPGGSADGGEEVVENTEGGGAVEEDAWVDVDLDSLDPEEAREEEPVEPSPGLGPGPATMARIHILDFYTAGVCRPGEPLEPVVEFVLDGPGDGELAELQVEWDMTVGGVNLRRDSFSVEREAGSHELEFEVVCPEAQGQAELHLLMLYPDRGVEAASVTRASVRGAAVRSWAKLSKPTAKRCIDPMFDVDSDEDFGIQQAQGLEPEEISLAVRAFQEQTLRCQAERDVSGTVQLEMTVGCDGLVTGIDVVENDTGDPAFADCVAETMSYCGFPAHAREDGVIFVLPLRFE